MNISSLQIYTNVTNTDVSECPNKNISASIYTTLTLIVHFEDYFFVFILCPIKNLISNLAMPSFFRLSEFEKRFVIVVLVGF